MLLGRSPVTIVGYLFIGILLSMLYLLGTRNYLQGKKFTAAARPTSPIHDSQAVVAYLRPFADDTGTAKPFGDGQPGTEFSYLSFTTEEEQLTAVMNEVGAFKALGRPGEPVPELGAERTYADSETWQQRVKDLISVAQLVIIRLGMTEWVIWEMRTAIEMLDPRRLVLLVPWKLKYSAFHSEFASLFPAGLPLQIGSRWFPGNDRVRGIIYFDSDWKAHFVGLKHSRRYSGTTPLKASLKIALSPVIERLGLHFGPLRVPWAVKGPVVAFLLFLLLAIMLQAG